MSTAAIEHETTRGQYDMQYDSLVVDHPEHGRLLLMQGFGGVDQLRGGAYRWEHGAAYQLQPGDTLERLREAAWNEWTSLYDAVLHGHDASRPMLEWNGHMVRAVAESAAR